MSLQQPMNENEAILRIAMEFIEMPDLKLTSGQAQRLWNVPPDMCEKALANLVSRGFLTRTADGAFLRGGSGAAEPFSLAS